jgi:alpha-galactosidase
MIKITFLGAGSTVFAKNVLGDVMSTPILKDSEIALYDIDEERLNESFIMLKALNQNINQGQAVICKYLGVSERREALRGAKFIVNAIQVGGYDPCTITDFEIPKKFGLQQTIADTLGIGGIFRALRTIPVLKEIARDIEDVSPDALLLNYTNPMAMLTGYLLSYTKVKTIGLCHSVQICSKDLLEGLDMKSAIDGHVYSIAGINHMAWLLEIKDKNGVDLYPEIKKRVFQKKKSEKHRDMVRFEYIRRLGYYCTESSEHNAEYNPFFIKSKYPELIEEFNIPLDEYPRRCEEQIKGWKKQKQELVENSSSLTHERSKEYASYIMEAILTNTPFRIGGNVLNHGLITNLPSEACVEVPCLVDGNGIRPCYVGKLPTQLAAMNISNISPQLLTIEAAVTESKDKIYQAAMMDPHTAAELSIHDIEAMCDELINAHKGWLPAYH